MKRRALNPTLDVLLSLAGRRGALLFWCLLCCPNLQAQQVSRTEVEAILIESVRFVLDSQTPGKYNSPVLFGAGMARDFALAQEIDPTDLTSVVAERVGIPVWGGDEEKFCDLSGRTPHWRMKNADFRLSVTLKQVSGETALVSVPLSGSSSLAGTTQRTLELRHTSGVWAAVGYVGPVLHGTSTPCDPAPPILPPADLASVLVVAVAGLVENLSDSHPSGAVRHFCITDPMSDWGETGREAVARELRQRGMVVYEECAEPPGDDLGGIKTPGGEPAAEIQLGKPQVHSETLVTVSLGTRVGTRSGACELFPFFPCRQICAVKKGDGVWNLISCEVVSTVGRGEPIQDA